jgi:hypothetical protein
VPFPAHTSALAYDRQAPTQETGKSTLALPIFRMAQRQAIGARLQVYRPLLFGVDSYQLFGAASLNNDDGNLLYRDYIYIDDWIRCRALRACLLIHYSCCSFCITGF